MSFTFQAGQNPLIDYVRVLTFDTVAQGHVFEDESIQIAYQVETSAFQSSMFFSGSAGRSLPSTPIPYRRIAATLLDAESTRQSRIAAVTQLLDVKLDAQKSAQALRDRAQDLRDADDNNGAFVIVEQVTDWFSFRDRFWSQWQRQQAG